MRTRGFVSLFAIALTIGWRLAGHSPQPVAAAVVNGADETSGTVTITAGWQGHYFADGDVAGRPLRFLIDTGATTVALTRDQAKEVGVDVDHLTFDREMRTASGTVNGAEVSLPRVRIGDIQLSNVLADVLDEPTPPSAPDIALLGQSFLSRLQKVSIEGNQMTLSKT